MAILGMVFVGGMGLLSLHKPTSYPNTIPEKRAEMDEASGDTNNEVLRQLTAEYQQLAKINKDYQKKIDQLSKALNSREHHRLYAKENTEIAALQKAQQQTLGKLTELQNKMSKSEPGGNNHYPVNSESNESEIISQVQDISTNWQSDTKDYKQLVPKENSRVTPKTNNEVESIPVYTIPALSNLANTALMTALIGEVPTDNRLEQPPFPFEAIVGHNDLLAANGLQLPNGISGMKIAGYSIGTGSFIPGFSCVRSYITKVLFVFDDGHFVSYGKDHVSKSLDPQGTLGYLSDTYGNPCMQGQYITNAERVLKILTGVGIAMGAGQGLSQAQTTTLTGADSYNTKITGSTSKYALGYGVSYSADKTVNYIIDKIKGTFDVVYIPSSIGNEPTKVVATFTQSIPIDFDSQGRKMAYEQTLFARHPNYTLD